MEAEIGFGREVPVSTFRVAASYSITSSPRARSVGEMISPSALGGFESDRELEATLGIFLFQSLTAMLMFGAIFVRLRRERQARAREPSSIRRSRIKPSIDKVAASFCKSARDIMDDEMRKEFSKLNDTVIRVGAKNDFGWISLAFTVNYVLLGIILWRLFG